MKRLVDILIAGVLLLLIAPIGLVVAAILAVTGEREIFYPQPRIGKGGRQFKLLKFVTMLKDSPNLGTGTVTVPSDPRVLPVGRFLRKTKINELPQLINVLLGDMSMVGPRPLTRQTFDYYSPEVQRRIVRVRPGLTGVGSIVFRDEERLIGESERPALEFMRDEIAPYKGALELWYIERRSLLLDIKLLFLTAAAVVWPQSRLHEVMLEELPAREQSTTAIAGK